MKIKPVYLLMGIASGILLILGIIIVITRVIFDYSWWWTFGYLIILAIAGIVFGVIKLIKTFKKKPSAVQEVNYDDLVKKAKYAVLYDDDYPDNFIKTGTRWCYVGQQGKEMTEILWLPGYGTETLNKYDVIMNVRNKSKPPMILVNESKETVESAIKRFAENPEIEEVQEKTIGTDDFGRPQIKIKSKKMTSIEKDQKEKEEVAKVENAF